MAIQQLVNLVLLLDIRIAAFITILYDQAARLMSDWTYTSESIDTWQFWVSANANKWALYHASSCEHCCQYFSPLLRSC